MSVLCNAAGEALQLAGTGLPRTDTFTLMGWFLFDAFLDWGAMFFRGSAASEWIFGQAFITPNAAIQAYVGSAHYGVIVFPYSTWFHFAVTKNAANDHIGYVNGVADSGLTFTEAPAYTNTHIWVGCDEQYTSQYLRGSFAAIKIWNRVLNVAEIRQEMRFYDAVNQVALHGVWPCLNLSDRRDYSRVGCKQHLTVVGGATDGTTWPPLQWYDQRQKRRTFALVVGGEPPPTPTNRFKTLLGVGI